MDKILIYKDLIFCFIILLETILIIFLIKNKRSKNVLTENQTKMVLSASFDFEKDLGFLNEMIDSEINKTIKFVFPVISSKKKGNIIKDSEIKEQTEKIVSDILDNLSPYYMKFLSKYFDGKVSINQFMINRVYMKLLEAALLNNKKLF